MIKSSENSFRILVTDSQHLASLGAIRSFGKAGHAVTAAYYSPDYLPPAVSSRHACDSQLHPDAWSRQADFQEWLLQITASEAFDVLLPVSEAAIVACNAVESKLPQSLTVLAPSLDSQIHTLSKFAATRLAQENGLATPNTLFLGQPDSWPETWRQDGFNLSALNFPVVIKSDNHFLSNGAYRGGQTLLCESQDAAIRLLESRRDSSARFIAQEYIRGHGEGAFLLIHNGETRLRFTHRRIHEIWEYGGGSSLRESSHRKVLIEEAHRLLNSFNYEGLAMVEFRQGDDGKAYFLEINGRPWGSIALALHSGIDFPLAWLELAMTGQTGVAQKAYRAGLRCCNIFPGEIDFMRSAHSEQGEQKSGRVSAVGVWVAVMKSVFNPVLKHDQFWWSDPAPGISAAREAAKREIRRQYVPRPERQGCSCCEIRHRR